MPVLLAVEDRTVGQLLNYKMVQFSGGRSPTETHAIEASRPFPLIGFECEDARLIWTFREAVDEGGLMCYGPNLVENFRTAVGYVDKILKGATAGDLPIAQATKFDLVINLKTSKTLGSTIPPSVLLQADEVIQ